MQSKEKAVIFTVILSFFLFRPTAAGEFTDVSENFSTPSFFVNEDKHEFSRPSADFNRPPAHISNKGDFSKNSFVIASTEDAKFSRNSFNLVTDHGEFSKNSFFIASKSNKGEFSENSFAISFDMDIENEG
jgi:hypothetical protein